MKNNLRVLFFFLLVSSFDCSRNTAGTLPGIGISSYAPNIPVLKFAAVNPILRISVSIPEGSSESTFKSIHCTINPEAVSAIKQIDLYYTGTEVFAADNRIATVTPTSAAFTVPVSLVLKPGIHFIWMSVVLLDDAAIDGKITLKCSALADASGKQFAVKELSPDYSRRIGLALRKIGDAGVHTYRIPGIIQTNKGTLIAVYDIRYTSNGDLPGNIDVGMSRSTDQGKTWEPMKVIMDMGPPHENNGIGDPAVLYDPQTSTLFVAALWSKGNRSIAGSLPGLSPDSTGQFVLVRSSDDGLSWTAPYTITPEIKNPAWHIFFQGPGNGIAMQDGKLVFAAQYWNESKVPYSTIIFSDNHGSSWIGKILGPKSNTTESQVVETTPGTLMLNMRDNRGGFRSVATTSNMGASWTEHATSYRALPDPVCMGSLIKAKVKVNGNLREVLFFSNPAAGNSRYNMTVKASLDQGETWQPGHQLLYDERSCYGYSCITPIDEDHIGILYEGTRELYFIKVAVGDIIK